MKNMKISISNIKLPKTGAVYGFVILTIFFSIMTNKFITVSNMANIVRQASVSCIITICSFLAVLTRQTDLSVGAVAGLTAVVTALAMNKGVGILPACLIGIAIGLIIGIFNGVLIGYTKVAPFIITLGTMTIAQSIGIVLSNANTVPINSNNFIWLGEGNLFGMIPVPAVIALLFFILFSFILKQRPYGTHLYAVGGREESALASCINVKRIKVSVFSINGMLAAIAGFILAARLGSANPSQGMGLELDGICGAVLGGASLSGGKGSIWGALLGAITLAILRNGLNIIGISSAIQMMTIGAIMILILMIDTLRSKVG